MSFALRASRTLLPRASAALRTQTRTFVVTAPRQSDIVQDLYLRELKAYKPAPPKANDHEGQVRNWATPATPAVPDLGEASLSADISAYQSQIVETESGAPDASADEAASTKNVDDWFDEEAAFAEDKADHH
ncbi:ATP synthase subunit [Drechslerella dactyloides]|uniref:ATP synthase subunit n=1 Tax=Drechslerella dactyloides TaxID=74499 RepID=A0AAD6IQJ6_DREDA|nr:ATP synthase subunit [Drechslerella dactyloides]